MLEQNSRVWMWYKQSTQPLNRGQRSQLFTWMYNSASAISLDLRAGNKRKGVVYCTQESWTQDKSQSKQRDGLKSAEWNQPTQKKQHTMMFNVIATRNLRGQKNGSHSLWGNSLRHVQSEHQRIKKQQHDAKPAERGLGAESRCRTFRLVKKERQKDKNGESA